VRFVKDSFPYLVIMNDLIADKLIDFVKSIGLTVQLQTIEEPTFLPGLVIKQGGLVIDKDKLLYPGDILHEAGHLAVMPPEIREAMDGDLDTAKDFELGGELMAIPWSYAACLYLELEPQLVFHKNGYKSGGESIIANFSQGQYFGVPMLQWIGLCYEPHKAKEYNAEGFPKMLKWLRE